MSLLGKILLFVNLLAGAGFVYLATQDWKGRQEITAAGLRHVLVLRGLPFTDGKEDDPNVPTDPEAEIPFQVEMAGGTYTETASPKFLKRYFDQAGAASDAGGLGGNAPVPSQLAEARRVRKLVADFLAKQDGAGARATPAFSWLILTAETLDERVQIQELRAAGDGDALAARLLAKFDRIINAPKPADTAALAAPLPDLAEMAKEIDRMRDAKARTDDIEAKQKELAAARQQVDERLKKVAEARAAGAKDQLERRAALAHLLVHLDRDPGWQKRVMMVVGVREYVKAVVGQVARFRDMAGRVDRLIAADQDAFIGEYAQLRGLAIQRTQMARDIAEVRARLEEQKRRDEEVVAQRKTQLKELTDQLNRIKAEVDQLLAKQTAIEAQLFAIQAEVGRTLEDIYRLEAVLAKTERERVEGK